MNTKPEVFRAMVPDITGNMIIVLWNERLYRKPPFIRFGFPTCSPPIASRGCDSSSSAGECKNPKERYKNLFLSIANENRHDSPWDTTIHDEKVIAFSYYSLEPNF
jgi:hypothetical protein